jgi:hypothetical protein
MAKGRKLGSDVRRIDGRKRNRGHGGERATLKATPQRSESAHKKIDENQIKALAAIDCTVEEIAAVMKCSTKHIQRYYRHIVREGREIGKMSLRRFQNEAAKRGNPALLIWLGKQRLGQKDKQEIGFDKNPLKQLLEGMRAESVKIGLPEGRSEPPSES